LRVLFSIRRTKRFLTKPFKEKKKKFFFWKPFFFFFFPNFETLNVQHQKIMKKKTCIYCFFEKCYLQCKKRSPHQILFSLIFQHNCEGFLLKFFCHCYSISLCSDPYILIEKMFFKSTSLIISSCWSMFKLFSKPS